jgi:hypothetical protein
MNTALEFHDSEVQSAHADYGCVTFYFSKAYIHQSDGRPGVDRGTGHIQAAKLSFQHAHFDGNLVECVGQLSDGFITIAGTDLWLVPLPFSAPGPVQASFVFKSGATLRVDGKSVDCSSFGPSTFVEDFPESRLYPDLR